MRRRLRRRLSNYDRSRIRQEMEMNRYYGKPRLERAAITVEKAAKKYDDFLENLRTKGIKSKAELARIGRAIKKEFKKTKQVIKEVSPDMQPVGNYFQRARRNIALTSPQYQPVPFYRRRYPF